MQHAYQDYWENYLRLKQVQQLLGIKVLYQWIISGKARVTFLRVLALLSKAFSCSWFLGVQKRRGRAVGNGAPDTHTGSGKPPRASKTLNSGTVVGKLPRMWKLKSRDNKSRLWKELGNVSGITDAAARVLQEEEDKTGALFFSVYVDPVIDEKTDAELLCRLEYHGKKAFYLLTRALQ